MSAVNHHIEQPVETTSTAAFEDRILRLREVLKQVGLGRTTLLELVKHDKFPKPVRLSANAVGWKWSDVQQWIATRRSA